MSDRFVLHIYLENEAMQNRRDVAKALRGVADRLDKLEGPEFHRFDEAKIMDVNGNTVGGWEVKGQHDDNDE